jgi:hypothetical protein
VKAPVLHPQAGAFSRAPGNAGGAARKGCHCATNRDTVIPAQAVIHGTREGGHSGRATHFSDGEITIAHCEKCRNETHAFAPIVRNFISHPGIVFATH